ncbi:hypothetical protein A3J90_06610 [candidate division WOR-1 bacterium RIFOXYC2_FULL_37_10]|uniref:Oxidoreductase n=1 Tax=candidate division WOR-1 bacterium RIFOXYB2_FULL_37_13 TaxID=1802579 RepID=A0A1F4SQ48_UNCSA|nr:MAG: hypothetical protein A2246_02120 [candidate division WOR-1 bacterium RIFOXYA2_FULL_37_7]OGC22564.1 MAG: hypothetical protein A2310_07345 [candidate division WOR-1 bacterium RIFOXYB2_FULL_37_13]OGC33371.1 MAG: hypothetical protein A3J90_06610 [candidate division WOR-1 bacterium RIFOXYC2_FULL_37_10]
MKFVVVGLGSIGRRHLKNLISLGEKDIVLCRNKVASPIDDEFKEFPIETNIYSALKHEPDAVIISNPTSLHFDIAIPAAEAGCHILIEKPISDSLAGIDKLKAALKHGGGQFLVGFQYRFHPTLKIASNMISQGEIGRIVSINVHWGEYLPDWHPWEDFRNSYAARPDLGGGVVLTLCHPFDYLSWLFGKPEFMWAHTDTVGDLGINVEDVADVYLKFPNGAFGSVHLDYIQRPTTHHLEVIGTNGTIRWNNADGQLSIYRPNHSAWEFIEAPKYFERNSLFIDEMRHFLSVIRRETEPICTLDDGINALEIALQTLSFKVDKSC